MTGTGAATYVYCAVRGRTAPAFGRRPGGLPGMGEPRALDAGRGLWLIVADAPLARYGAALIERRLQDLGWVSRCALGHEAIVEHVARGGPVIPMKLFTLFSSDARAVSHVVGTRKKIDRLLDHVAGRHEWGIRLSLDERVAVRRRAAGKRLRGGPTSGTGFLLRKKAQKDAVKQIAEDAVREAQRIFDDLGRRAADSRRRTPVQSGTAIRVLLDAAFLVPVSGQRRFRTAVAALGKRLSGYGYELTLTGPWPPYSFVSDSA